MHEYTVVKSPDESNDAPMSEIRFLHSTWQNPVADGYINGCASGEAAAIAYVQFAKQREKVGGGTLQSAAIYFAKEFAAAKTSGEADAILGKIVGFFSALDEWIDFAVKNGSSSIMSLSAKQIIEKLEDAANGGPGQRWKEYMSGLRSARGRVAANARWSKVKATA